MCFSRKFNEKDDDLFSYSNWLDEENMKKNYFEKNNE